MKVAWLTPFGAGSDIGSFSKALLDTARHGAGRFDYSLGINVSGPSYFFEGPTLDLSHPGMDETLRVFDAVIYNIGNNTRNHTHINRLALQRPGVVVVHDLVMQHYFAGHLFETLKDPAAYASLLLESYGASGLAALASSRICAEGRAVRYAPWDSPLATRLPLIEPFIASAAAVIVHSEAAAAVVAPTCRGPMLKLALPHDQKPTLEPQQVAAWHAATRNTPKVVFASFGHVARNKCLPLVIQAFAARPELRSLATLRIVGYATDRDLVSELRELVRALEVEECVQLEFDLSVDRLQAIKDGTDVFVNLRWPNTEGASASLVEQLNTARPVIVYPTGCYAEVPEDAIVRVPRLNSVEALADAMVALARDPEQRINVGARGQAWCRRIGARAYIEALETFLQENRDLLRSCAEAGSPRRSVALIPVGQAQKQPDGDWAVNLALHRDRVQSVLAPRQELELRPFLSLAPDLLVALIVLGCFRQPDLASRPGLVSVLEAMLAFGSRLACYGAVRQALLATRKAAASTHAPHPGRIVPEAFLILAHLHTDALAQGIYVLVLRRVPAATESAGYAARLAAGESASSILREVLDSEEYAALTDKSHEPACELGMRLAEAALHAHSTDAPLLRSRTEIRLTSTTSPIAGLLVGDWHIPEPWGTWSAAAVAMIRFRREAGSGRLRLVLKVPVSADRPTRRLSIYVNAVCAAVVAVERDEFFPVTIELAQAAEVVVTNLTLMVDRTMTGNELSGNGDDRQLGIAISTLLMEAGTPIAEAPLQGAPRP